MTVTAVPPFSAAAPHRTPEKMFKPCESPKTEIPDLVLQVRKSVFHSKYSYYTVLQYKLYVSIAFF